MQFTVRWKTDKDELFRSTTKLGRAAKGLTRKRMMEAAKKIHKKAITYPEGVVEAYGMKSSLTGSAYKRTYRHRDKSKVVERDVADVISFRIQMNARNRYGTEYSKYVVGDAKGERQQPVHEGRWVVLYDVAQFEMFDMVERLNKDFGKQLNR